MVATLIIALPGLVLRNRKAAPDRPGGGFLFILSAAYEIEREFSDHDSEGVGRSS